MSFYASGGVPENYRCGDCGAHGVKLWRLYQTFADKQELRCLYCAEKKTQRRADLETSDQIGNLIPAVPCEDEPTYWGYTSVPNAGVLWWKGLPNRPWNAHDEAEDLYRFLRDHFDVRGGVVVTLIRGVIDRAFKAGQEAARKEKT